MAKTPRRDRSERDLAEALKEATAVEVPELPEGTAVFLASLARKRESAHSARVIRDQVTQDQSIQDQSVQDQSIQDQIIQDHGLRGQLATGGLTQPRRVTHRVRNSRIAPHIGPSQGEAAPLPYWAVLTPCAVLPAVVFLSRFAPIGARLPGSLLFTVPVAGLLLSPLAAIPLIVRRRSAYAK